MENEKVFLVGHCDKQYDPIPVPRKIFSTKEKAENYVKEILCVKSDLTTVDEGYIKYINPDYPNEYCIIEEAIVQ